MDDRQSFARGCRHQGSSYLTLDVDLAEGLRLRTLEYAPNLAGQHPGSIFLLFKSILGTMVAQKLHAVSIRFKA